MKRLLLALLTLIVVNSLSAATYNGSCGSGVYWELNSSTGILRIYGSGKMNDYAIETFGSNVAAPYKTYSSYIRTLQIEEGVTYVGENAFYNMPIYYIYFPSSLKKIGKAAFHGRDNVILQELHVPNLETLLNMDFTPSSDSPCTFNTNNPLTYSPRLYINEQLPTTIHIPNTYSEIKNYVFHTEQFTDTYLFQVTTINIPSSIVNIGAGAVMSIDTIRYEGTLQEWCNIQRGNTIGTKYGCEQNGVCDCKALFINGEEIIDLTIPEGVNSVGTNVFSGCSGIKKIIIPEYVNMIDYHAFYGSTKNLEAVYVQNPVPPSLYTANNNNSQDYIFGYTNPKDLVVYIPCGSMNTYKNSVWNIFNLRENINLSGTCGDNLTWKLTSDSILTISGTGAMHDFENVYDDDGYWQACTTPWYTYAESIKSVSLPTGITSIGQNAFADCVNLTAINMPNTIKSLGASAFANCSKLSSISIPNSVTSIGQYAFVNCTGLVAVYISDLTSWCKISFGTASSNPLYCAHHLYLNNSKITNLTIPSSITTIKAFTFSGASSLTSLTIPNSITSIGESAFLRCSSLSTIKNYATTPQNVGSSAFTMIGTSCILYVPASSLAAYQAADVWKSFANIQAIAGTEPATTSGNCGATGDGSNLQWFFDPSTGKLTISGSGAMQDFEDVYDSNGNWQNCTTPWYEYRSSITSVSLPSGLTSIGQNAFFECAAVTSITIPSKVSTIGDYAFYGCTKLESLNLPNNVTDIGTFAFAGIGLTNPLYNTTNFAYLPSSYSGTYTIPSGIKTIAESAFANCNKVSKVIIPNTVTKISDYAFYNCSSLTSITIPDNVANIGGGVFTGCSALATVEWNAKKCQILIDGEGSVYPPFHSIRENITSFVFGSTVETIPEYVCLQMTNLHSVTIPTGVQSIGSYAFYGCSGLDTITNYAATPQTIDSTVFYNVNTTSCSLFVPAASLTAYQSANGWKSFANIRALASDEELGDTDITQFSNVVYFNDLDCRTGSETTLPIQLRNSHPVIGFNFKLYLPEGVSVKSEVDEWDDVVIDAGLSGTRTNASRHTFETALNDEGVLTVLCYSTKNNTFSGNEGEVGYIRLVVDENMEEGTYPLIIREEAISLSDSTPQIYYIQSSIHVTRCMAGDANGDNVINVGDITAIASYILENTISGFVSQAADVNGDGFVNVGDITALAQMILNDGNQTPVRFTARGEETEMEAQFAMNVDKVSDNSMNLVVGATNSENAFSAFQFDIVLPEDVQMSDVRLLSRCSYMTFDMTVLDNHRLRVIAYSLDDARVPFMSGELVSIALNGVSSDEFTLTNGIFANGHRTLYVSDVTASYQTPTDIEDTSAEKNAEIYDILGRKLNGLQKGIQIVGNQIIFIP